MKFLVYGAITILAGCSERPESFRFTDVDNERVEQSLESSAASEEQSEETAEDEAVTIRTSQGSGGPVGMNEVNFTDSSQLTSSYKIMVPDDVASKVYGLSTALNISLLPFLCVGARHRGFPSNNLKFLRNFGFIGK